MSDDDWPTVHKTLCFQRNLFDCMHRHIYISQTPWRIFGLFLKIQNVLLFLDICRGCLWFIEALLKIICNLNLILPQSTKKFDLQCCLKGFGYYIYSVKFNLHTNYICMYCIFRSSLCEKDIYMLHSYLNISVYFLYISVYGFLAILEIHALSISNFVQQFK